MAIAYRSSSAVATGGTSLSITMPAGVVQNDIMVMVISCHDTGADIAIPSGWTETLNSASSNGQILLAWKRAGGAEAGPYSVTGLADSACGAISSFSGCRAIGSPVGQSNSRANAAGASGTTGITTTENGCMIVSAAAVMDNLALSAWLMGATSMTERFDGRTTTGSDTGVGLATYLQSSAGATGATAYTIAAPSFENIGLCFSLLPLVDTGLTMANTASAVASDTLPDMTENSTLVMASCSHAVAPSAVVPVEHKTLEMANGAHATTSSAPVPVHTIVATILTQFFTWVVTSPAIGGIPGPKLPRNYDVQEVSSYVTAATSVTFNIEERSSIGSGGTDILSADQVADTDGSSSTSPDNKLLAKGSYLWLDISDVSGTPGKLTVTLKCTDTTDLVIPGDACSTTSQVPSLTQAHTLAMNNATNAVTSTAPSGVEDTDLVVDTGEHAVSSTEPLLVEDTVALMDVPLFYCWVIATPATGTIGGPKMTVGASVDSIHSYIVGGTSVEFNIEERDLPTSSGTDIMAADQAAITTGAETTSFSNGVLAEDKYLGIHISSVTDSPSILVITLAYTASLYQKPDDCEHAVASTEPAIGPGLDVDNSEHSTESQNITLTYHETPLAFTEPGFYTWVINNPSTGGIPGPKVAKEVTVVEVSSYVTGAGATASFNVESRTTIGSTGTDILSTDQAADETGESASGGFQLTQLPEGRYLWLDISGTTGTPGQLVVTLAWEYAAGFAQDCEHTVVTSDLTLSTTAISTPQNCSHATTSTSPTPTKKLSASVDLTLTVTACPVTSANASHAVTSSPPTLVGTGRIYFPSTSDAPTAVANNSVWDETWDADSLKAVTEKGSTALANKSCTAQNFVSTYVLNRQYVLCPPEGLAGREFTVADTFNFVSRNSADPSSTNIVSYMTIDVYSKDGLTHRGEIFSGIVSVLPVSTTLQSRYTSSRHLTNAVSMQDSDILVFGLGVRSADTSGTEYTVSQDYGDAPATALSLANTDTDDDYPYLEFSFLLYEYSPPANPNDCEHAVTSGEVALGVGLPLESEDYATHEVTSGEVTLTITSASLVMENCAHAVASSSPSIALPSGRKLWIKIQGVWVQVAPDSGVV